jgi:hypothetical protein
MLPEDIGQATMASSDVSHRSSRSRTEENRSHNDDDDGEHGHVATNGHQQLLSKNPCSGRRGGGGFSKEGIVVLLLVFLTLMGTTSISSFAAIYIGAMLATPNEGQAATGNALRRRDMDSSAYTARPRQYNITTDNHGSSGRATTTQGADDDDDDDPREIVKTKRYNNKTMAFIAYGSFNKAGQARFQSTIIDSLRTWLKDNVMFFVLNNEWKDAFQEACDDASIRQECMRIIPIFVDCPEGYYGPSPCCKMDQGMTVMWQNYSHYDWYSYQDDDMYIRTEYLDDFLSGLSPNDAMVLTSTGAKQLGNTWAEPQVRSNCSSDLDYRYPWGQPAMYSRAGLERISRSFQMGATTKQCQAFGVTHDVGNPIVHWMVGLPVVRLPSIESSPPATFTGLLLGVHGVGKPGAAKNITEVHAQLGHMRHPRGYTYRWHKPNGFLQTTTYKLYGNVSEWTEWHTMNASDCRGPPAHQVLDS